MAGQRIVFGGRIEVQKPSAAAPKAAQKPAKPLPLFEGRRAPSPGPADASASPRRADPSSPARGEVKPAAPPAATGELAQLKAEREELLTRLEPLGRYSYRRRKLEEQLAALTTSLLRLETGR